MVQCIVTSLSIFDAHIWDRRGIAMSAGRMGSNHGTRILHSFIWLLHFLFFTIALIEASAYNGDHKTEKVGDMCNHAVLAAEPGGQNH